MKKIFYTLIALACAASTQAQQTTAMDFTMDDCNGTVHHLFGELDQQKVVILEFFMTCNSCITAGHKLEAMKADLDAEFPGKIEFYQLAYTNSYSCSQVQNFQATNGFNAVPFDSGAAQVAYYGGFGMPTVVVVAGSTHEVLFTDIGFSTSDTTQIGAAVRAFYATLGTNEPATATTTLNTYPNPANSITNTELNLQQNATVDMQLFDATGREVTTVYKGNAAAGTLTNALDVSAFAPGMYVLRATVNGATAYSKISVTR